ncbi:hypothetical protein D3OALGB2SA_2194 [Olavius algarvensis associated proteobacterium Delta 3]|nr:hypothetical protein D3OALGB2SA_2194 [Olavius algarvensis associated proteobacterium Delta 3]
MATAKTNRKPKKKATSKNDSRLYVVKTAQETKKNILNLLGEYNQKLIEEPMKSGKTLACNLKKQPLKTVADLFEDGNEYISDLNRETRAKVNGVVKESRSFIAKTGKNPRKTISGLIDDGKELVEDLQNNTRDKMAGVVDDYKSIVHGVSQDTRLIMEALVDGGKKAFDKVPGKQKVQKAISGQIQEIPSLLNLPSQKEVDSIVRRLKKLNTKVETLSKAQAA